jgi:hypothetical protein
MCRLNNRPARPTLRLGPCSCLLIQTPTATATLRSFRQSVLSGLRMKQIIRSRAQAISFTHFGPEPGETAREHPKTL